MIGINNPRSVEYDSSSSMKSALIPLGIAVLFVFLRLYALDQSLLFFGDLARDFHVLQSWSQSGRPPLLGPQTSALSFNQSALYFYLLYPFYWLLDGAVISTAVASVTYHLIVFLGGWWFLRFRLKKYPDLERWWLIAWFLMAIHPQFVAQQRMVWNPSFVGMMVAAGFLFFALWWKKANWRYLWGWSLSVAAATSFSYSAVPVLLVMVLLALERSFLKQESNLSTSGRNLPASRHNLLTLGRSLTTKNWQITKNWLTKKIRTSTKIIFATAASLLVVNLPTIFFELRHGFVLTRLLFVGQRMPQEGLDLASKLRALERFVLVEPWPILAVLGLSLTYLVWRWCSDWWRYADWRWHMDWRQYISWWWHLPRRWQIDGRKHSTQHWQSGWLAVWIGLLNLSLILVVPMSLQAHYIFGVLTSLIIIIAILPKKLALLTALVCTFVWVTPAQLESYFRPAARSFSDTMDCGRQVCEVAHQKPVFVSVQSGYHPYHSGPEFMYILGEQGCNVFNIALEPEAARHMVVFADNSSYEHGRTDYYELGLFGPSLEQSVIQCLPNLSAHILEKVDP